MIKRALAPQLSSALAFVLISCGSAPEGQPVAQKSPVDPLPGLDSVGPAPPSELWKDPLGDEGVDVSSTEQANLPYAPQVPDIGHPESTIATAPGISGRSADRQIAWVFDDGPNRPFFVVEAAVDYTQRAIESQIKPAGCETISPGPEGEGSYETTCVEDVLSLTKLDNDATALVVDGPTVKSIIWLGPLEERDPSAFSSYDHPALETQIWAPAESFTKADVIELANEV